METVVSRAAAPGLPGLDLVRAAAISWVLIYHGSLFGLTSQAHWLVANGWMGVDLFFVLSGFLIAGQLLRPWAHGSATHDGVIRFQTTSAAFVKGSRLVLAIGRRADAVPVQVQLAGVTFTVTGKQGPEGIMIRPGEVKTGTIFFGATYH